MSGNAEVVQAALLLTQMNKTATTEAIRKNSKTVAPGTPKSSCSSPWSSPLRSPSSVSSQSTAGGTCISDLTEDACWVDKMNTAKPRTVSIGSEASPCLVSLGSSSVPPRGGWFPSPLVFPGQQSLPLVIPKQLVPIQPAPSSVSLDSSSSRWACWSLDAPSQHSFSTSVSTGVSLLAPRSRATVNKHYLLNTRPRLQSSPRKFSPQKPDEVKKTQKKFSWKIYPELEAFLVANRCEYLQYSTLNYTRQQKRYNNRLTERLLALARIHGYSKSFEAVSFVTVRDRIRCYYKSYVQSLKKRGIMVGYAAHKKQKLDMILGNQSGTTNS